MLNLLSKLFDTNAQELKKIQPLIERINQLEDETKQLADEDFKGKTAEFKARLAKGETLDGILPEAFALVREASLRSLGLRHYDVQLIAGVAFHKGMIGEQKTGEGKTLSATLALYLNSLSGKGVHLVTVNDYLAQRDAGWNGPLFDMLGVSVGVIIHDVAYIYDADYRGLERGDERLEHLRQVPRNAAYGADITYGTSTEFGFDYLRDNMAQTLDRVVQREHNFAIIDEVDSILIDEARTPLIISAPDTEPTDKYVKFSQLVSQLDESTDFEVDEKLRSATLSDAGIAKVESMLGVSNLYEKDYDTIHHLEQALKARTLFHLDKEYVIRDGAVVIVDENTGRLMPGRRYSDGLHQAIEAKEAVAIQRESKTLATISIQNYFRMYHKLAGMTGTAATEAEEFRKIYGMDVLVVPTNRDVARQDHADLVFKTKKAKYDALVNEVAAKHKQGQPVLLGTRSVEQNEVVSGYLKKAKIPHQALNAKNHEREAAIIANAGKPFGVTVATNIAGRGVDIVLGGSPPEKPQDADDTVAKKYDKSMQAWREAHQKVLELGGLHVIGTERHESRRIDNQLRGRSGRQGDPGSSRFYVALDDEIMRIFGGDQVARLMTALKVPEDQPIEARLVSRSIASAQSKVEGFHFDQRKHLVEYDDVLNKQREIIYKRRNKILRTNLEENFDDLYGRVDSALVSEIELMVNARTVSGISDEEVDAIVKEFMAIVPFETDAVETLRASLLSETEPQPIIDQLVNVARDALDQRVAQLGKLDMARMMQYILLSANDELWINHLDNIEDLRQGIWMRGGQETALAEYKKEAYDLFETLIGTINAQVARRVLRTQVAQQAPVPIDMGKIETVKDEPDTPTVVDVIDQDINPFAKALAKTAVKPVVKDMGTKTTKVGRNDPCPCGSGKKWKKCGMINSPEHKG